MWQDTRGNKITPHNHLYPTFRNLKVPQNQKFQVFQLLKTMLLLGYYNLIRIPSASVSSNRINCSALIASIWFTG